MNVPPYFLGERTKISPQYCRHAWLLSVLHPLILVASRDSDTPAIHTNEDSDIDKKSWKQIFCRIVIIPVCHVESSPLRHYLLEDRDD